MSIVEGALLDVNDNQVRAAMQSELVHVFVDQNRITGVIVTERSPELPRFPIENLDTNIHIAAIAVRPKRRNQGIGRALIQEIMVEYGTATVTFEEPAMPFYQALNVAIVTKQNKTYLGVLNKDCC
jgi:ribosomal protein S18 acetylase RimI-like enzyme